jgi:hypothetical protein
MLYFAQGEMIVVLRKSMRQRFDDTMGKARFAYVERENISLLTCYMNKNLLLITLEPNVDSHTAIDIAEDALDLLKDNTEMTQ